MFVLHTPLQYFPFLIQFFSFYFLHAILPFLSFFFLPHIIRFSRLSSFVLFSSFNIVKLGSLNYYINKQFLCINGHNTLDNGVCSINTRTRGVTGITFSMVSRVYQAGPVLKSRPENVIWCSVIVLILKHILAVISIQTSLQNSSIMVCLI